MTTAELRATVPRVITKLENEEFIEALKIAESNSKVGNKLGPLRCYIHYKQAQYQKVVEVYKTLHNNVQRELGMLHLLGQAQFKLGLKGGSFTDTMSTYQLIGELFPHESFQSAEYIANALAAYVNGNDLKRANTLLERLNLDDKKNNDNQELITYETLFNASFVQLQSNQVNKAADTAQRAYDLFKVESGSDIDQSEEVLMKYHLAYIHRLEQQQSQNEFDQVNAELFEDCSSLSIPVQAIFNLNTTIAKFNNPTTTLANNTNTTTKNNNTGDLIRTLDNLKEQYTDKLSKTQLNLINFNLALFYAANRSIEQATKHINQIPTERLFEAKDTKSIPALAVPNQSTRPSMGYHKDWLLLTLQLYTTLKDKDYGKCDELLTKYQTITLAPLLTQTSTKDYAIIYHINAILARLFIALYRHQTTNAISHLQTLCDDQLIQTHLKQTKQITNDLQLSQQPAILALFITLYEEAKDYEKCAMTVDNAINLYQTNPTLSKNNNTAILTQLRVKNATVKASAGDYRGAITSLETLAANCDKRTELDSYYYYISQIVSLCNANCPDLVEKYITALPDPSLDDLDNLDLDQFALQVLDNSAIAKATSTNTAALQYLPNGKHKFTPEKLAAVRLKKKIQRQKKPLLPRNVTMAQYIAAKAHGFPKVDPYRWKPKWERPQSTKNGKKGQQQNGKQQQLGRGPQGSGVSENKVESNVVAATQTNAELKKQQIADHLKKQKKGGRR